MSLEGDKERGRQAQEILDSPIYKESHAGIEAEIIRQWREARNSDDREQLHQLLLMHGKAKTALESVMRSGLLADADLGRKMGRAEAMAAVRFAA